MQYKNYIWDVDGTLIDSYPAIIREVMETLSMYGLERDEEDVYAFIIRHSVKDLAEKIAGEEGLDAIEFYEKFGQVQAGNTMAVEAIPHAEEVLAAIRKAGGRNFVFTHRKLTAASLLDSCGLGRNIEEVLSAGNGIPRKPEGGGILHLMAKYDLKKEETCYVGDRILDMESAENAGIEGILYDRFDLYPEEEKEERTVSRIFDLAVILEA